MTDNEIDCLIEQLNSVRIAREAAVRVIGQSDRQEAAIVRRIQNIRAQASRTTTDNARPGVAIANAARHNNLRRGQIVRITNRLRDEYNITGEVISTTRRIVVIRNELTGNRYSRAWWNLEVIEAAEADIAEVTEVTEINGDNTNAQ